jgi:hypothetical protein
MVNDKYFHGEDNRVQYFTMGPYGTENSPKWVLIRNQGVGKAIEIWIQVFRSGPDTIQGGRHSWNTDDYRYRTTQKEPIQDDKPTQNGRPYWWFIHRCKCQKCALIPLPTWSHTACRNEQDEIYKSTNHQSVRQKEDWVWFWRCWDARGQG